MGTDILFRQPMGEGFLGRQPIEEKTASAQKVKEAAHTSRFWFRSKMPTKIFCFVFEFILREELFMFSGQTNFRMRTPHQRSVFIFHFHFHLPNHLPT
jgi:hypothetical protein